ncbi:hypothetical protein [Marinobacterium sp. xm-a-152]|jgi:hypothetical protein|uniref:hypothetical protein n=1 Tax=Marinobacterium sp. xm-a-152 TaxID=2497733 RepID=UPI001569D8C4|nr:hypothetical protein [Marinobacterium sp. xm-a-152]NRP15230.1 hypothetical protein [Marinobacterium sp. xm-a-152]
MNHLPHQYPDELLYGEFQTNELKPKGILDFITQPLKPNEGKGLLSIQPTSQGQQPTTLWECLGVEES